jgi:hypothetical protein
MRGLLCVAALASLGFLAAGSAAASEAPGRVIPDGKTSRGGDFAAFFNTNPLKVEGLQWGPETTTSIRRVTGKGTVVVKSAHCTTGTLTFSVREP